VLKAKWLEGKRNRRVDHLIHTLIKEMHPDYVARYDAQDMGFKGSNLKKKRRKEILARTPEMNAASIRSLGDDRFEVQSSDSSRGYLVDLGNHQCDCPDWPRVRLCKHVSAVAHLFGREDQQIDVDVDDRVPKTTPPPPIREGSPDADSDASAAAASSILENVITVSREFLNDGVPSSAGTVQSLRVVEAHLTAVVRNSRSSESPLPDKEEIPPNQRASMWTETAKRMGATRRRKRAQPSTTSSPEPPATARIGDLNRKQARVKFTDPYSGGVSSGRNAAPDARTAAQNTEARALATAAANGADPPPSQPPKRGRRRAGVPAPPTSQYPPSSAHPQSALAPSAWHTVAGASSAPPPPSGPPAWYPVPAAYAHTPYHSAYPLYWPYGYFPPSQPYRPPPQ
jgi:hypothetical protein